MKKQQPLRLGKMIFIAGFGLMPLLAATSYSVDGSKPATQNVVQTPQVDDRALDKSIHDKIDAGWVSKGYPGVRVNVEHGKVFLQGVVDTQKDKDKVEKEIRNLEGVKALDSRLQVKEPDAQAKHEVNRFPQDTFKSTADDQLNKKIRDNVSKGILWDSYTDVVLNSNNGNVVLTGSVNSVSDQESLVSEIKKVEGVKSVTSDLKVKKS